MADPAGAVQASVIARLRGDATLQGLMTGASSPEWNIYDQGGSGANVPLWPYVFIHPITTQLGEIFAMGMDSMDVFLQVSVFTQGEGFAQARAIAARCYALLHGPLAGALSVTGFTNVLTLFANRQELEEVHDQLVQHIVDRYKVVIAG